MGKSSSILNQKVCLYKDFYTRDMVGYTYSMANLLAVLVWVIIIVIPFIMAFSSGGKFF